MIREKVERRWEVSIEPKDRNLQDPRDVVFNSIDGDNKTVKVSVMGSASVIVSVNDQPCSCLKCHAESLIGVDTIAGLGKHEASYVGGYGSLDEAIEKLRDYRPTKGPEWSKYSDEDFQRHVPRWIEEAKRASEWLVSYQREHFAVPSV